MFFSVIAYTLILFVIYTLVPNTKVRKKYAAISASICGLIFASMQYLSYSIISMFNSYKSIYGDLATMIVFLLWIYYAWTICLAGSKWNYYLQNADVRERERNYDRISTDCFTFISLLVIERIECMYPMCHEFDTNDLTKNVHRIYNIPISIIHKVLNSFKDRKILWNKNNNKVCLNYNFSNLSVEELLYKLPHFFNNSSGFLLDNNHSAVAQVKIVSSVKQHLSQNNSKSLRFML
jgi:hypothetical protein